MSIYSYALPLSQNFWDTKWEKIKVNYKWESIFWNLITDCYYVKQNSLDNSNAYSEQRGRPLSGLSENSNLNSGCGKCENYDSKLLSNRKWYSFDI